MLSCSDNSTGAGGNGDGSNGDNSEGSEVTTGSVEIITETTGDDIDGDGYTALVGDKQEDMSTNGSVTFEELEEGSYDAELSGIADNCSIEGENSRSVEVTAGETTSTTFDVSCESKTQDKIIFGYDSLFKMNSDGTNQEKIADFEGHNSYTTISPDGSKIAYIDDETTTEEFYVLNSDGTNRQQIEIRANNDIFLSFPTVLTWSPDGSKLAFGNRSGGEFDIFTVNVETAETKQLTDTPVDDSNPNWSPDGEQILYEHEESSSEKDDLYTINVNDGSISKLTDNSYDDELGFWSPNGEKIAFRSDRNEGGIYTMDADGSNVQKIADVLGDDLTWSPDGSQLLYMTRNESADEEKMHIINADGSGESTNIKTFGSYSIIHGPDWGVLNPSESN